MWLASPAVESVSSIRVGLQNANSYHLNGTETGNGPALVINEINDPRSLEFQPASAVRLCNGVTRAI
jgi:hypothetical protein